MSKQLAVTLLLLVGNCHAKADVQELSLDSKTYLPPLSHKLISNSYLPTIKEKEELVPAVKEHTTTTKDEHNYQHNQPKAIDDPLPVKIDCVQPLDIDLKNDQHEPVLKGAFLTGLIFNIYENPLFKKNAAAKPSSASDGNTNNKSQESNKTNTKFEDPLNSSEQNITGESSIQSKKYLRNPLAADVVPINYFVGAATKYKLFNHDDDIELSGSAPVVIYKAGDDIAFSKDTTAIDDYEHNLPIVGFSKYQKPNAKKETLKAPSTTTKKPLLRNEMKKNIKENATAAASTTHMETSADPYASAATKDVVTHEKSESTSTGRGYIYDKPKIPFTF